MKILIFLAFAFSSISIMGQHSLTLSYTFDKENKVLTVNLKNRNSNDIILRQERQPYDGSSVIEIFAYNQKDSIMARLRTNYIDNFPAIIHSKAVKSCNKSLESLKTEIPKNEKIEKIKIRFIVQSYNIGQTSDKGEHYVKEVEYNWK
ncbi:hypothetical protein [Bacteroides congonensis]